jgi:hypothetical protein
MSQVRLVMAAKDQRGLMKTLLGVLIAMEMAPAPVTAQLPTITNQPASLIERLGATAVFAVGVRGAGPFTYQRQCNGTKELNLGQQKAESRNRRAEGSEQFGERNAESEGAAERPKHPQEGAAGFHSKKDRRTPVSSVVCASRSEYG